VFSEDFNMMTSSPFSAILFDLDGTLLDTAGDLGHAFNRVLTLHKQPVLPLETMAPFVGQGSKGLIKIGFGLDESAAIFNTLREEFFSFYEANIFKHTRLFLEMAAVIETLNQHNFTWGIVTNKPKRFTDKLLTHFPLLHTAHCVVSGDTLTKRKPYPDPLWHACDLIQKNPAECVYIGDAEIDIVASQSAGLKSFVALYGYIPNREEALLWGADFIVETPIDILGLLFPQHR
jgi:2-phosphoglycolate phosphatase